MIATERLAALGFKSAEVSGSVVVNSNSLFEYRDGAIFHFSSPVIRESKTKKGAYAVIGDEQPVYIGSLTRRYNLVDSEGNPLRKWVMNTAFGKAAADCLTADDFIALLKGRAIKVSKEKVTGIPTFSQVGGKWTVDGCKTAMVTVFEWAD